MRPRTDVTITTTRFDNELLLSWDHGALTATRFAELGIIRLQTVAKQWVVVRNAPLWVRCDVDLTQDVPVVKNLNAQYYVGDTYAKLRPKLYAELLEVLTARAGDITKLDWVRMLSQAEQEGALRAARDLAKSSHDQARKAKHDLEPFGAACLAFQGTAYALRDARQRLNDHLQGTLVRAGNS